MQSRTRSELAGEDDLDLDAEGRVGERALTLFHEAQAPAPPHLGRVLIRGGAPTDEDAIRRRIQNVAARAGFTQPERQIVSVERRGDVLEVEKDDKGATPRRS